MAKVTLIFPYYCNPGMLQYQYDTIAKLPNYIQDELNLIVIDDGSPKGQAFLPKKDLGIGVQVYRIDVDVRWNQDAARNIGMRHSETEWNLLTDIDHVVPHKTWERIMNTKYDEGVAYKFGRVSAPDMGPYKHHPNTWLMSKKLWAQIGGYDERFAGYYGTDGDFRDRVVEYGDQIMLKEVIIRIPRSFIKDASTTNYLRKQPEDRENIARIKSKRDKEEGWRPQNFRFPYHRVTE